MLTMASKVWKNPLLAPSRLLEFTGHPRPGEGERIPEILSGAPLQRYSRELDKLDAPKPLASPFTVEGILRSILELMFVSLLKTPLKPASFRL